LAVTAWKLAEQGKKVLVLDLDLESPGLSSNLLPEDRRPSYGITDWLVEDLVDNGDQIINDMVATSLLSRNGEILAVPAHGREFGEYIAKLGRVWMPKPLDSGHQESWSDRLERLISKLEQIHQPDVILIDSRAGIDEVASTCITHLKADLILLFALAGAQTWTGYSILFDYWLRMNCTRDIRERLQMVASMIPEMDGQQYVSALREKAHEMFTCYAYDELQPDEEGFNFDEEDDIAPHYPWLIRWHRSLHGLASLHNDLEVIDKNTVRLAFGDFLNRILPIAGVNKND
jgi:CheY-like chemotaxis protein